MNQAPETDNTAAPRATHVNEVTGFKRIGIILLGALLRLWQATLRYEYSDSAASMFRDNPDGALLLLWHNRIFSGTGALRRVDMAGKRLYTLISTSRDGAQVSQFARSLGLIPIRGSSSRRASTAALEIVKVLKEGNHIAITVDGPRGPRYHVQPGAAMLMQQTGVPANLVVVECASSWELKSWDGFLLPKPFSRVEIKMDRYAHPDPVGGKEERTAIQQVLQERLDRLTEDRHRKR